jgi:hypothetical protein
MNAMLWLKAKEIGKVLLSDRQEEGRVTQLIASAFFMKR